MSDERDGLELIIEEEDEEGRPVVALAFIDKGQLNVDTVTVNIDFMKTMVEMAESQGWEHMNLHVRHNFPLFGTESSPPVAVGTEFVSPSFDQGAKDVVIAVAPKVTCGDCGHSLVDEGDSWVCVHCEDDDGTE